MFSQPIYLTILSVTLVVLMGAGCVSDIRARRIPNRLVLAIFALGTSYSIAAMPWWDGIQRAVIGTGVGLGIWLPFYLLRMLGAGDVKFFAAASAWLGPQGAVEAALLAALIGGLLSVGWLWRGSVTVSLTRLWLALREPTLLREPSVSPTAGWTRRLPYGVAMALGVIVVALLPSLLH